MHSTRQNGHDSEHGFSREFDSSRWLTPVRIYLALDAGFTVTWFAVAHSYMADSNPTSVDKPIRNFRIRLWGVQGSCPMFPEHQQVEEFKRLVVQDVLNKVFRDMNGGNGKSRTAEEILGGPLTPASIDAYQRHLGLAELPEYGGDTTCLSIETSDGEFIVLDGGSGIRNCSKYVMQTWPA